MWKSTKTVALEQHMDAITVAVAAPGRQPRNFAAMSHRRRRQYASLWVGWTTGRWICVSATRRGRVATGCTGS